jgi:hypothetical protein
VNARTLAVCAALACALAPLGARADQTTSGLPTAFTTLPPDAKALVDAQLKELRGKYVPSETGSTSALNGRVIYFGLELQTTWATAGAQYGAAAQLAVDLSGPTPKVYVVGGVSQSGTAPQNATQSANAVTGATPSAQGVTQTIQIAGNGNTVGNATAINVSTVKPVFVSTPASGGTCASCSVVMTPNAFGVAISLPGGTASQTFGTSGAAQNVRIATDGNTIMNSLQLGLQVQHAAGAASIPNAAQLTQPPIVGLPK